MALETCTYCGGRILVGAVDFNGKPHCPGCKTKVENLENVRKARDAYRHVLSKLAVAPADPALYEKTVELGRLYISWAKHAQGQTGVEHFDEVTLANDIQAACKAAVTPMPSKEDTGVAEWRLKTLAQSRGANLASNLSHVKSGAEWAKWLGIAKVVAAGLVILLTSATQVNINYSRIDAVVQVCVGALFVYLGSKLRNEATRRVAQFTILVSVASVLVVLHAINWLAQGGKPAGQLVPILTAVALWKFFKGRRQLRSYEKAQAATAAVAVPNGTSIQERLVRLQGLRDQGLVTETEFCEKRSQLLAEL